MKDSIVATFLPRTAEQRREYPMWDVRVLKDTPCKRCKKVIPKGAQAYGNTTTVFHAMQGCPGQAVGLTPKTLILCQQEATCSACGKPIPRNDRAWWVRGSGVSKLVCLKCGGGEMCRP